MASDKQVSKFLSLILRHDPEQFGVVLNEEGWADVAQLLERMQQNGTVITAEDLQRIVRESDKQRFAFSADGKKIRANQGHSIEVDLGLEAQAPPAILYHGTADKNLSAILREGLRKGARQQVHLSPDTDTAVKVGSRHGRAVVLRVNAERMYADGYVFYRSENGVWLTENVPPQYLSTNE